MTRSALALGGAYVLGSLPFSYWVARWRGVDLYQVGSGNVGATNVARALGPRWGALALGLDAAKGAGAVALGHAAGLDAYGLVAAGFLAILGHVFSLFLRFRGGKGVATSLGVFLALEPAAVGVAFLVFMAVLGTTRYVSLGSLLAGGALVATLVATKGPTAPTTAFAWVAWALLVWRHRENIQRLRAGTESRFGQSGTKAGESP